jgi:hypothetical protein
VPVVAIHPRAIPSEEGLWPGEDAPPEELIQLFQRNDLLSFQAVKALKARGSDAVPALVLALNSQAPEVRKYSARVLGGIKDPTAIPALIRLFGDDNSEVRWEAAEALAAYRERGIRAALEAAARTHGDLRYCRVVAHVLERAPARFRHIVKPVLEASRTPEFALTFPIAADRALRELSETEGVETELLVRR